MAETSITTDGFLETTAMDPLHEDSPMETGDLNKEEEAALLCRNPGEDEDQRTRFLALRSTRTVRRTQTISRSRHEKSNSLYVQLYRAKTTRGTGNVPETSAKSPPKRPLTPMQRKPAKMKSRAPPSKKR